MANIQKAKIGSGNPDAIMFDKYYEDMSDLKFDFTTWVLNDIGHDVTIEKGRITIRKFVPNTWIIRSEAVTGYANSAICTYCRGTVMNGRNISTWASSLFGSQLNTSSDQGAGSDTPKFRGFVIYPMTIESNNSYWMPQRVYTWESTWVDGDDITTSTRSGAAIADWGDFRLGSGGHGVYGIWSDFTQKTMFPSTLLDVSNWLRATYGYTATTTWYYGMGLYSGAYPNVGEGETGSVIDISDNPIVIELYNTNGIDLSSVECWDAYAGDEHSWHKDKTIDNCWLKYNMATDNGSYISMDMNGIESGFVGYLPETIDYEEHILPKNNSGIVPIAWNANISNTDFWEKIKAYLLEHPVIIVQDNEEEGLTNLSSYTTADVNDNIIQYQWFANAGITGDFTIKFDGYFLNGTFSDCLRGNEFDTLTLQILHDNCRFTVAQNMFRRLTANTIQVVDANGNLTNEYIKARDCSAMCEMSSITYFPDIVDWDFRLESAGVQNVPMQYAFSYCGDLVEIAQHGTSRDSDSNTIIVSGGYQTFQYCYALTTIGPILDLAQLNFADNPSAETAGYCMFQSCTSLSDVRIKNLNGSCVHFDDDTKHGYLSALDSSSLEYLFNNLTDLTTYNSSVLNRTINNSWSVGSYDDDGETYIYSWQITDAFVYDDSGESTLNTSNASISNGRRYSESNATRFIYPTETVSNMTITVSGLITNDTLTYNDGSNDHTLTNGTHTISMSVSNTSGFTLTRSGISGTYVDDFDNLVTLTIVNSYNPSAPKASSASLYLPTELESKITSSMITTANSKNWTVYVGGSLKS